MRTTRFLNSNKLQVNQTELFFGKIHSQKVITVYWALLCDIITIYTTNLLIILHVDVWVNKFCFVSLFIKEKKPSYGPLTQ